MLFCICSVMLHCCYDCVFLFAFALLTCHSFVFLAFLRFWCCVLVLCWCVICFNKLQLHVPKNISPAISVKNVPFISVSLCCKGVWITTNKTNKGQINIGVSKRLTPAKRTLKRLLAENSVNFDLSPGSVTLFWKHWGRNSGKLLRPLL